MPFCLDCAKTVSSVSAFSRDVDNPHITGCENKRQMHRIFQNTEEHKDHALESGAGGGAQVFLISQAIGGNHD